MPSPTGDRAGVRPASVHEREATVRSAVACRQKDGGAGQGGPHQNQEPAKEPVRFLAYEEGTV
ncbi:hypothetical protein San01_50480 [Streptomyces angustmyceticus]|uniref:Uncharacterized protein n=1 Tax=Streptomyces angustmyceticus TaxID=285578 RepID=A0A5J4LKS1_9ACTN|nr:hypothetical protein San01_50480 [Streptomyces angustmyceticus]